MQTPDKPASLLTPIGYQNSFCGYCHNNSGSFSYYAKTPSLTPKFYQLLLDRGWRRSGRILYKPDLHASCCPQYTIRLDSSEFHATKDQRQSLNRFNKYILGESYIKDASRLHSLSKEDSKKRDTLFDLVKRVHESEEICLDTTLEPAHHLTVSLEPDDFTEEKYFLFENYQKCVHQEPPEKISRSGFKNFLCVSPLTKGIEHCDGVERRLGSYHQCYRIDGKLVAMGVLDLLPTCVSAVYFMYDESVRNHSFGKLGALREIALAKEDGYRYWYAGFYIHSCVKMRYKGDYSPQYVLDPESYGWDLLDGGLRKLLDEQKYVSMSDLRSKSLISDATAAKHRSESDQWADLSSESTLSEGDEEVNLSNDLDKDAPLFARSIPGVLSRNQLLSEVDLDDIRLRIRDTEARMCDLVSWDEGSIDDVHTIKGIIGELAAAVGPTISRQMIVAFG